MHLKQAQASTVAVMLMNTSQLLPFCCPSNRLQASMQIDLSCNSCMHDLSGSTGHSDKLCIIRDHQADLNLYCFADGILHLMRAQGKDKSGFAIWSCPLCPTKPMQRTFPRPSLLHQHIEQSHGDKLKASVKQAAYLTAFWLSSHSKFVARLSGMRQNKDENPKHLRFSTRRKASASSVEHPAHSAQQNAAKASTAKEDEAAAEVAGGTVGPGDWSPSQGRITRTATRGTPDTGPKVLKDAPRPVSPKAKCPMAESWLKCLTNMSQGQHK